jgi:hypothetical protein
MFGLDAHRAGKATIRAGQESLFRILALAFRGRGPMPGPGITPRLEHAMAKGQKKSNREIRKPKADKGPKQNASQPSLKPGGIKGLENMKNG